MSSQAKPFEIAIVGGGIAGVVLSLAFQRKKIPVTLYEAAPAFGEIGAGVSFGPNAQDAMRRISPDVEKGFNNCATYNQWPSKKDLWFDFRLGDSRFKGKPGTKDENLTGGDIFHQLPCKSGQASVHRAHFLGEMTKLLDGDIAKMGKRVVDAETLENGDVELKFQDGTTARHEAVIGCDGIKSCLREVVIGKGHPAARAVYTGKYAYRGLIPMDKATELLGEELAMNSQLYSGYGGHMLTFAIEKGKTMNVVAFSSSEKWENEAWIAHFEKEEMYKDYDGWSKHVRDILTLMKKSDVWALFNHPPAPTYYKGRICLLGDAAHASTPHQGAGAGMCIEDAFIMSELIAQVQSKSEIEAAFAAYDEIRRPRTQKLVTTSEQGGLLYDFEKESVKDDLDAYRKELDERMLWIWEEDLGHELDKAHSLFRTKLEGAS